MAEDWSADVLKYVPDADPGIIAGIIRFCGIALQSRDSSLVSFSDPTETARVRENFLKKKLGLTASDADLDGSIAAVGERMKTDRTKNRVTVYYLLAEHFGMLGLFGKPAATPDVASAAAGTGAAGITALGAAGLAGGAAVASGLGATASPAASPPPPGGYADTSAAQPLAGEAALGEETAKSGFMRWLPWVILAAALLLLLLYLSMHRQTKTVEAVSTEATMPAVAPEPSAPAVPDSAVPAPLVAIPAGAGVTTELRDGKPAVNVYFDTAKTSIAPAFGAAAASLKDYLDKTPGSKLAVSGFNDKTGNAAANAELSKNRAKAVKAALVAAGIPDGAVDLVKPSDATDASTVDAAARRVEVVVQ
jgi:outer membrane protein OmpA-like peptidoglycan-associated protein